jgi:plasmid stabilization system protein ParE
MTKRQRTGALQDASRISGIIVSRAASWTAAALRRFSQLPYLIFYRELPDRIQIWRVLHGAHDLHQTLGGQ